MKKIVTGLLCAFTLFSFGEVWAEEPAVINDNIKEQVVISEKEEPTVPLAHVQKESNKGTNHITTQEQDNFPLLSLCMQSIQLADGVITNDKLPSHTAFYPMLDDNSSMGTLLLHEKGQASVSTLIMMDGEGQEADALLDGFFKDKMMTESSKDLLKAYTRLQYNAEGILNNYFLHSIKQVHSQETPIPYDFINVKINHIDGVHIISQSPRIYKTNMRVLLIVDGFILPYDVGQYLFKSNGHYHVLTAFTQDSMYKVMNKKVDQLVDRLAR